MEDVAGKFKKIGWTSLMTSIVLDPVIDENTGAWYNFLESEDKKGELERLLKLLTLELDRIRFLFDSFPNSLDIDECEAYLLPYIAKLIGLELNQDLPIDKQRTEIKNHVRTLKWKGTKTGFEILIKSITGFDIIFYEYRNNILFSNTLGHNSVDTDDTIAPTLVETPDDRYHYSVDTEPDTFWNFGSFGIYILTDDTQLFTKIISDKVVRAVQDHIPMNSFLKLFIYDKIWEETLDISKIEETWDDTIEY